MRTGRPVERSPLMIMMSHRYQPRSAETIVFPKVETIVADSAYKKLIVEKEYLNLGACCPQFNLLKLAIVFTKMRRNYRDENPYYRLDWLGGGPSIP